MTPTEREAKITEMRERLKSVPAGVQLERLWRAQTHCFVCDSEVAWDAAKCHACGELLM